MALTQLSTDSPARQAGTPDALTEAIVEQAGAGIFVTEAVRDTAGRIIDFRFVRVNPMAYSMNNRPIGDMTGQTMLSLFPGFGQIPFSEPDASRAIPGETIFARHVRQMAEGASLTYETSYYRDGLAGIYVVTATPLLDGLLFILTDVTRQRQADTRIRKHEQLLNSLLAQSGNGTIVLEAIREPGTHDEPGLIVDFLSILWNDAALRISSLTEEQVRNQPLSAFRANFQTVLLPMFANVLNTGQPTRHEYVYEPVGRWMRLSLSRLDADHLIMLTTDIHDLKQAQQRAEEQADLLAAMLENTKANITLYEPIRDSTGQIIDFRYAFTNAGNARSTGRSVAEMTGNRLHDLFPGIQKTEFYTNLIHTAQTGEPLHFLFPYHNDGVSGWFDVDLTRQGQHVLFTSLDVTELKNAELELLRSNDYLQQFAYVASHDLQEPLRKIQSFGNMLTDKYGHELSEAGVDMLMRMQRAASRMSDLVHDLLTYSRLTTQQAPFEPVNLNNLVQDVLGDLDLTIRTRNARLTINDLPTIVGDAAQLRQLFQNLLANALKYVDADQMPVISIDSKLVGREELPSQSASAADSSVRVFHKICITDNGIGFDEQYLDRIFQMFQRLHGRSQFEGSGMGLAICKRVVDNHHGCITARSQVGQGATFMVFLPN